MERRKRYYYQVSKKEESEERINWSLLPESIIDSIKPSDLINILSYSPDEGIQEITVVCFKEVDKIDSSLKEFEINDEITLVV